MYQPNQFDMENMEQEYEFELISDNEDGIMLGGDGMNTPEGDHQGQNKQCKKKKHYHRHSEHQIRELEMFFKQCSHPDDKQRNELGRRLALEPQQVKFWFQNKRTQIKSQHEHHDNKELRNDSKKLRVENMCLKEALANANCNACGRATTVGKISLEEQQQRMENARLKMEIDRITRIANTYTGKSMAGCKLLPPEPTNRDLEMGSSSAQTTTHGEMLRASDLPKPVFGLTDDDKPLITELAIAAMEELVHLSYSADPLWIRSSGDHAEKLSENEYVQRFTCGIGPKPFGMKTEASRDSAIVFMNQMNLVEILMDTKQWSTVFASIVSRAVRVEVLSTGFAGTYNGALHVMNAEFQVPSPLVPTRDNYFVRYSKQNVDGTWAVVDVSLDNLRPSSVSRCRRRPSGCLIREMPNGYSKVIWVEHVEVDDKPLNNIYMAMVNSGNAFGAKRWLATLERYCERQLCVMELIPTQDVGEILSAEGRNNTLKLSERMKLSFLSSVGASTADAWAPLSVSGADDVRFMTRRSLDDPGSPCGNVLSTTTSFWLPVPPKHIFDFLRHEHSRSQWDILSNDGLIQKIAHIATGRDSGNCVSLFCVDANNSTQKNMLILQESCSDLTGFYVVYAPLDASVKNVFLGDGDPDYTALLPSGFAILPDEPVSQTGGIPRGSLLTIGFQILLDSVPTTQLSMGSMAYVKNMIKCVIERIKAGI